MSKSTISTFQLFAIIPDAETARQYLEGRLWPDGPVCPDCKSGERVTTRTRVGFYRCNACKLDFTVRTGTIFERSKVPLHKWVYSMYLLVTARKGISSLQLSKEIGITQKSAWFVLHRLREACAGNMDMLRGIVAVDEVWIGGLEKNKHENKRLRAGKEGKSIVLGMREHKGRTKAFVVPNVNAESLTGPIAENVEEGSTIYTDEHKGYMNLSAMSYQHETVEHKAKEYVRGNVSTNNIETVWAVLKRGLHGVYHHASAKHLGRYVDEFTFRLNEGKVQRHTLERLDSFVDAIAGKRITWKELTT